MAIHKIKIFSGRGSEYLAEKIAASFGTTLGQSEVLRFSDGEFQPCFNESIRGCTVFIIQSTFPPSDNLMELLMMIDAARRASAYKVVAVIPYFGWARQDRKDRPRVPIGAKLVANLLMAAGVDRVMTMDLHADQIQGFFDVPVDALYASGIFIPYIKSLNIEELSIAAPDMGGAKRANTYAKLLGTPIIISHKERAKANVVGTMTAIGEVEGRNILIVDDMIDTAGTICMAADMLMSRGAKSVRAAITHPVLSGPAYERINDSALQEVIVTDTIPLNPDKDLHKFTVLSVADMFADVIERVHNYKEGGVSEILSTFVRKAVPVSGNTTGKPGRKTHTPKTRTYHDIIHHPPVPRPDRVDTYPVGRIAPVRRQENPRTDARPGTRRQGVQGLLEGRRQGRRDEEKGITARKGCGAGENDIVFPRSPGLAGAENAPSGTSEKPRQAAGIRYPESRQASGIASGQQKPCTQRAGHTGRHR